MGYDIAIGIMVLYITGMYITAHHVEATINGEQSKGMRALIALMWPMAMMTVVLVYAIKTTVNAINAHNTEQAEYEAVMAERYGHPEDPCREALNKADTIIDKEQDR